MGELFVADHGAQSHYHNPENVEHSRRTLDVELTALDPTERKQAFPYLSFGDHAAVVWEARPAGHINPRALIQAQVVIGESAGGAVVAEQVSTISTRYSRRHRRHEGRRRL